MRCQLLKKHLSKGSSETPTKTHSKQLTFVTELKECRQKRHKLRQRLKHRKLLRCKLLTHCNNGYRSSVDIVAIDCEFVGIGPQKLSALGRCSIVNYGGDVICDIYVIPDEPITDYRTPWSGIRKHDLIKAIPFECARNIVKNILQGKLIVGHAVHNDLNVLRLSYLLSTGTIRDTSQCLLLKQRAGLTHRLTPVSLKTLTAALLGRSIQQSEHDSVEDARAAMDLYRHVESDWEQQLQQQQQQQGVELQNVSRQDTDTLCPHTSTTSTGTTSSTMSTASSTGTLCPHTSTTSTGTTSSTMSTADSTTAESMDSTTTNHNSATNVVVSRTQLSCSLQSSVGVNRQRLVSESNSYLADNYWPEDVLAGY